MTELTELAPKEAVIVNGVKIRDVLRVDQVRIEDLGEYAGEDAIYTLLLYLRHMAEMQEESEKLRKCFFGLEAELSHCLAEMEMDGVPLDQAFLDGLRQLAETELAGILPRAFYARTGQDFAPVLDSEGLKAACLEYDRIDFLFTLPESDPRVPKNPKTGARMGKGALRTRMLKAHGLHGTPVVDKIRDDRVRPHLIAFPQLAHKVFNLGSTKVLNKVLFSEEGLDPIGDLNKKGEYSTKDEHVQVWAGQGSEMAKALSDFRDVDKMLGTYLIGMRYRVSPDGMLRGRFTRTGARTGRLSSSDPNLQNIPTSKKYPVRRAFKGLDAVGADLHVFEWEEVDGEKVRPAHFSMETEEGRTEVLNGEVLMWEGDAPPRPVGVLDYSQLEICLLAHASRDPILMDAVTNGLDVHALTARAVFDEIPDDMPLDEVKEKFPKLRGDAKPISFGVLYGMGPMRLAATLGISVEEAEHLIENRYMGYYVGVKRWIGRQHQIARTNGFVQTAMGRKRHLPAAMLDPSERDNFRMIKQAERQAQNSPIQGLASDVVSKAMRDMRRFFQSTTARDIPEEELTGVLPNWVDLDAPLWRYLMHLRLQVHDEVVVDAHPAIANWVMKETRHIMETTVKLKVPLRVSGALGENWLDAKD